MSWTQQHACQGHPGVPSFLLAAGVCCAGECLGPGKHMLLQQNPFQHSQDASSFPGSSRALRGTPRPSHPTIAALLWVFTVCPLLHPEQFCFRNTYMSPPGTFILILLTWKQSDKSRKRDALPHTSLDSSKSSRLGALQRASSWPQGFGSSPAPAQPLVDSPG